MKKRQPARLGRIEATCALRHLRIQRDRLQQDIELIQERLRGHVDQSDPALIVLDAEVALLDRIIRRLWRSVR